MFINGLNGLPTREFQRCVTLASKAYARAPRRVACLSVGLFRWNTKTINHQTAIFRQVNKEKSAAHHDALEFPDGRTVLLTSLCEGQAATVLQLPAQPATAAEAHSQERVTYVG